MNQWARNNPEACEAGETAYDYYADRVDQFRQERKDGVRCPNCGSSNGPAVRSQNEFGVWEECCEDEFHEGSS